MNHSSRGRGRALAELVCLMTVLASSPAIQAQNTIRTSTVPNLPVERKDMPGLIENSLGMKFRTVPGGKVQFSIWETRVQDYEAFVMASGRSWSKPGFDQGKLHPAVNVNWEDAQAFCRWLTTQERKAGRLTEQQRYRLPTDEEWSLAVGLGTESGTSPEDKMKRRVIWPWGSYWPPRNREGNYAPELKADSFANTAPVGSFPPNASGLYDLGGNVWEWCEDWYNAARVTKVLRGASFNDAHPATLLASYRFHGTMNLTGEDIGFRVVLESKPLPP
jgi:formylglycine-generating enzyme required for sulfatase activity